MKKLLSEKQLYNRLNKYYKDNYGELDTDEWYINDYDNIWKFERDGKIIILECNKETGKIIVR